MKILFAYFRHFVPHSKRVLSLLFRKKNYPILFVHQINSEVKKLQTFVSFELNLSNVLFIKINKNIYPVFHDNVKLNISIPIEENQKGIDIKALGLFKSKKQFIAISSVSKLKINSLLFDQIGHVVDKQIISPSLDLKNLNPKIDDSNLAEPILIQKLKLKTDFNLKERLYKIDYKQKLTINLDLKELQLQLKNQPNYE